VASKNRSDEKDSIDLQPREESDEDAFQLPLQKEIMMEKGRYRKAHFLGTTVPLFLLMGLVCYVAFFLKDAGTQMEERLEKGMVTITGGFEENLDQLFEENRGKDQTFVDELILLAQKELEAKSELKSQISLLEKEKSDLTQELSASMEKEKRLKEELKRHLIARDKERIELEAKAGILEEALKRLKEEQAKKPQSPDPDADAGPPVADHGDLLADINVFLHKYLDTGLCVVECEGLSGATLVKPFMRIDNFLNEGPALFMPDRFFFIRDQEQIEVRCAGGLFQRVGGDDMAIPASGMKVGKFTLDLDENIENPLLQKMLGVTDPNDPQVAERDNRTPEEIIMDKLNQLLSLERGRQYKFITLKKVEGKELQEVEMEQNSPQGTLIQLVTAKKCSINLIPRDRYVELLFSEGHLLKEGKQTPFFNQMYRLPIPNINNSLWSDSGLDCISEK
jgi:hypothetical protein